MIDTETPIRTGDQLVALVEATVGRAIRRRAWLLLFDTDDRSMPVVIPIDGMPAAPHAKAVAVFAGRLRELVDGVGAASVAVVWERPGGPDLHASEARWALGLHASDAPVRAQLLASDVGARLLDPELDALVA